MTKTKEKQKEDSIEVGWELKDRQYYLTGNKSPLTFTLSSRHSERYPLLWFDPIKKEQRALRYATNQASPFIDEQKGEVTLKHIMFEDGVLFVPLQYQALQKLLSLYHPHLDVKYAERKPMADAIDELTHIDQELDALNAARNMEVNMAEAILRVEKGTKVATMSSKEIKRDIMVFAKKDPILFLKLTEDDNVQLRNIAVKAVEQGVIKLTNKNKDFVWAKTSEKIMRVPFDENPYSAFASFLLTDEGVAVFKSLEKKLV